MTSINGKWINYGTEVTVATAPTITDISTLYNRLIRFSAATTIESLANGLSPGNNLPRELMITNATGGLLIVKNDSGGTAANRILTGTGADITMAAGGTAFLKYDPAPTSRWRIVGQAAGSNAVINPGDTGKFPYYNGSTSIDDTSSGTATAGMFWTNAARIVRLGISNTLLDSVTAQNGLVMGNTNAAGYMTGSIMTGVSNTFVSGGLTSSIFSGTNCTGINGTLSYSIFAGNNLQLPTGSDAITASIVVGTTHKVNGVIDSAAVFGNTSISKAYTFLSAGLGNWVKTAALFSSGNCAIGNYQTVYGYNSTAFGGRFGGSDRSFALANSCLIQGSPESAGAGAVAHYNSSENGQVFGHNCNAGNKVYSWTRSGTTITVNQAADYLASDRENIPLEFANTATCRFFQMTSFSEDQHQGVQVADVAISSVPAIINPYQDFSFSVASATPFGTKTSGKVVVLAGAEYSFASGRDAAARYQGQFARANGRFTNQGDAQISTLVMRKATTNTTPTVMTLDGGTTKFLRVPLRTAWAFTITVVGKREGAFNTSAMFKFEGLVVRQLEADDPVLIGTVATLTNKSDPAWDCTLSVNTTNNSLDLMVTGGAYNVKWVARVDLTEVNAG